MNIIRSDASLLAPKLRWDRPNRARNQKRSIALPQVDKLLQQYSKTLSKKLDSCSDTHHTGCKNCPGGCDEPEPLPPQAGGPPGSFLPSRPRHFPRGIAENPKCSQIGSISAQGFEIALSSGKPARILLQRSRNIRDMLSPAVLDRSPSSRVAGAASCSLPGTLGAAHFTPSRPLAEFHPERPARR